MSRAHVVSIYSRSLVCVPKRKDSNSCTSSTYIDTISFTRSPDELRLEGGVVRHDRTIYVVSWYTWSIQQLSDVGGSSFFTNLYSSDIQTNWSLTWSISRETRTREPDNNHLLDQFSSYSFCRARTRWNDHLLHAFSSQISTWGRSRRISLFFDEMYVVQKSLLEWDPNELISYLINFLHKSLHVR